MRFEQALQAMREGKKVVYREEIYFIDDENSLRRYQTDVDGILDTETSWYAAFMVMIYFQKIGNCLMIQTLKNVAFL